MAVSLRSWHTFQMSATCESVCAFDSVEKLQLLVKLLHAQGCCYQVLGHGSNVLFTKHYPGWILLNRIQGVRVVQETSDSVSLDVGGGVNWHGLVVYALYRGWFGIENLISIPGTVGAAPIQNIGAYGTEVGEVLESCEALSLATNRVHRFEHKDCQFGYRTSFFKRSAAEDESFVVTSVRIRLRKKASINMVYPRLQNWIARYYPNCPVTPYIVAKSVRALRMSRLPNWLEVGTVGSFFINPIVPHEIYQHLLNKWPQLDALPLADGRIKLFAGNLLNLAGLSGFREGGLLMTSINPMVVVNDGQADYQDLSRLREYVDKKMQALFGITLVVEPKIF